MRERESEMSQSPQTNNRRRIVVDFLMIFVPLCLVSGVLFGLVFFEDLKLKNESLRTRTREQVVEGQVDLALDSINEEFQEVSADLLTISGLQEMKKVLDGDAADTAGLARDFLQFAATKKKYDQIRYIDAAGMEIIRVNYNSGRPAIVPQEQLQNKARRYYFRDTFVLKEGQIYVSPLDLNIEHGAIEQPLKPMIRFGVPLFSTQGEKKGVLIINYLGRIFLERLAKIAIPQTDNFSLLNPQGYWLKGPDAADEWGFMYAGKARVTFGRRYPEAWERIFADRTGQFYTENGLFTFQTFYPLSADQQSSSGTKEPFAPSRGKVERDEYFFKIVLHTPPAFFRKVRDNALYELLGIFAPFIVLLAVCAGLFAFYRQKQREARWEMEILEAEMQRSRKMEAVGVMAGGITHHFNNIISPILGYTNLAMDGVDKDSQTYRDLEKVLQAVYRAKHLINKIVLLAEQKTTTVKGVHLESELVEIVASFSKSVPEGVIVETDIGSLAGSVAIDPVRLKQVVDNLLQNGVDAMAGSGGVLRIRLQKVEIRETGKLEDVDMRPGNYAKLTISDSGHGISSRNLKKIFDPFFTTKEVGSGDGIGLSVAYGIVRKSGGMIHVESKTGQGAQFYLFLPIT